MIEDGLADAFKNFNTTLMGSVLLLFLFLSYVAVRYLTGIIRDVQAELKKEREDHQKTREELLAAIRNLAPIAKSVDEMRNALVEVSLGRGRP